MKTKLFFLFILAGILYRLIPHVPNFSPVGSIALFSGFYFSKKVSWAIPISIMVLTDMLLGFHSTSVFVYTSFALIVSLGGFLKLFNKSTDILLTSLASSVIFYLLTNFGVWAATPMYPKTIAGLYESYLMAIPFFHTTLLSDMLYNSIFFGAYYAANSWVLTTQKRQSSIL